MMEQEPREHQSGDHAPTPPTAIISQRDWVCGMSVKAAAGGTGDKEGLETRLQPVAQYQGKTYFFCSPHCQREFIAHPERYVGQSAAGLLEVAGRGVNEALGTGRAPAVSSLHRWVKTYLPILLILAYLLGVVGLLESRSSSPSGMRAMNHFMGGFFLVFSFFKFLNLRGFVAAFKRYDLIAGVIPGYAWVYPGIELALGLAYLQGGSRLVWTQGITAGVMAMSSLGVLRALLTQEKSIECACLGGVFQLPMSHVSLIEDVGMLGMAIIGWMAA